MKRREVETVSYHLGMFSLIALAATDSTNGGVPWWSSLVGVAIGGLIPLMYQMRRDRIQRIHERESKRRADQGAARMLRDDLREGQRRVTEAARDGRPWSTGDLAPMIHTRDDLERLASEIKPFDDWGLIAESRRRLLRQGRANEPLAIEDPAKLFLRLEAARKILHNFAEDGAEFRPHPDLDELTKLAGKSPAGRGVPEL